MFCCVSLILFDMASKGKIYFIAEGPEAAIAFIDVSEMPDTYGLGFDEVCLRLRPLGMT